MEFGKYLKSLRENKSLSIRELSRRSGVSIAHISQIERGERGTPKIETLRKLAEGLNIPPDDLLAYVGHHELSIVSNHDIAFLQTKVLNIFSERLLKLCLGKGLSLDEIGEMLNHTTKETLETDQSPIQIMIDQLCKTLNVTRDYLFGYTNDPKGSRESFRDIKKIIQQEGPIMYDGIIIDRKDQKEKLDLLIRQAVFMIIEQETKFDTKR